MGRKFLGGLSPTLRVDVGATVSAVDNRHASVCPRHVDQNYKPAIRALFLDLKLLEAYVLGDTCVRCCSAQQSRGVEMGCI